MNESGYGGRSGHISGTEHYIRACEQFLRYRNFDSCRKLALQAQQFDPGNDAARQILAVADVISASETRFNCNRPDWYAILGLNRYSDDPRVIRNRFKNLILLLNPNKNKFVFADRAFDLVRGAWAVLSDPWKKTQFDTELRIFLESHSGGGILHESTTEGKIGANTFWTVCPYCYYVYEYPRVYEEFCLRCQNHNCNRGFHAVAMPTPPAPAVVKTGQYWCFGFRPLGFAGEKGKGFSSWTPFKPVFLGTPEAELEEENECKVDTGIENFADGDDSCEDELVRECKEKFMNASDKKVGTEEVKKRCESCVTTINHQMEVPGVMKPVMKRKKWVVRNTKKMMGRGTRIKRDDIVE